MGKINIIFDKEDEIERFEEGKKMLEELKIQYEIKIISGMDTLDALESFIKYAEEEEVDVIIVCSSISTHLPGIIASKTLIPVIGVPLPENNIKSEDILFSVVQMPEGVPVACMSLGKTGIKNAILFAGMIISKKEKDLKDRLKKIKEKYI
ncbi:MAG: AIR carboxylase family protein [bacterium]|nr:AIR carboxylase family protein [bacterium]MDW8164481.1 AIR carboxylase family protein [Candidatus Omnitrophota bacterium]